MSAQRVFIAGGIVVAGICAALPFRQSPPPPATRMTATKPLALTLRKPDAPLELAPRLEVSPAVGLAEASSREQEPADRRLLEADLANLVPPPALPVSFEPTSTAPQSNDWRPEGLTAPRPPRPPRPYRLRDGDTLEKIAERLLGDRLRANEIFESNREVLDRPDLLPVGVTIMLPPRASTGDLD